MKKFLLVVIVLLTFGTGLAFAGSKTYSMLVNGKKIQDQAVVIGGKLYLPAKAVLNAMGARYQIGKESITINTARIEKTATIPGTPNSNPGQNKFVPRQAQPRYASPKDENELKSMEKMRRLVKPQFLDHGIIIAPFYEDSQVEVKLSSGGNNKTVRLVRFYVNGTETPVKDKDFAEAADSPISTKARTYKFETDGSDPIKVKYEFDVDGSPYFHEAVIKKTPPLSW